MTSWTVAHQAPQSIGFSRQKYWSELSFPPSGDLPDPQIRPRLRDFQVVLVVKNLPANTRDIRDKVQSLGWEDPLKEMATHSSILAWEIPWTEEPGGVTKSRTGLSN